MKTGKQRKLKRIAKRNNPFYYEFSNEFSKALGKMYFDVLFPRISRKERTKFTAKQPRENTETCIVRETLPEVVDARAGEDRHDDSEGSDGVSSGLAVQFNKSINGL